jgi:hypothetical protein
MVLGGDFLAERDPSRNSQSCVGVDEVVGGPIPAKDPAPVVKGGDDPWKSGLWPHSPPARSRGEVCSLLQRLTQGADPYKDKSAVAKTASQQSLKIARSVRQEVCVKAKAAADAPMSPEGAQYFGQTVDDHPEGKGALFYADGSRYIGQFKAGLRQGEGIAFRADGARYVGLWDKDQPHGKGVLQYREKIDLKVADPDKPK